MVEETRLYEYGFDKYDVSETTGIADDELSKVAKELIHYFNSGEDSPQIQVARGGKEISLFNQKEVDHLKDVKDVIRLFYIIQWISLAFVAIYIITGFIIRKRAFLPGIMQALFVGSIFILGSFAFVGLWALIHFDSLFNLFHNVMFPGGGWTLSGYLVEIFPEDFFLDAALFLVGGTAVEALIIGGGAWVYLRHKERSIPGGNVIGMIRQLIIKC